VKPRALIIDGPSLISAMADTDSGGVKESLLTFAKKCKAVVGCRCAGWEWVWGLMVHVIPWTQLIMVLSVHTANNRLNIVIPFLSFAISLLAFNRAKALM